jgi:hypothetical protein
MWLLIWWSLQIYMVVNFRTHKINLDMCNLVRTFILIIKKKITSAASSQEKEKALHDEASLVALQQQVNMILSKNWPNLPQKF